MQSQSTACDIHHLTPNHDPIERVRFDTGEVVHDYRTYDCAFTKGDKEIHVTVCTAKRVYLTRLQHFRAAGGFPITHIGGSSVILLVCEEYNAIAWRPYFQDFAWVVNPPSDVLDPMTHLQIRRLVRKQGGLS